METRHCSRYTDCEGEEDGGYDNDQSHCGWFSSLGCGAGHSGGGLAILAFLLEAQLVHAKRIEEFDDATLRARAAHRNDAAIGEHRAPLRQERPARWNQPPVWQYGPPLQQVGPTCWHLAKERKHHSHVQRVGSADQLETRTLSDRESHSPRASRAQSDSRLVATSISTCSPVAIVLSCTTFRETSLSPMIATNFAPSAPARRICALRDFAP